jgi:hypothetical protein
MRMSRGIAKPGAVAPPEPAASPEVAASPQVEATLRHLRRLRRSKPEGASYAPHQDPAGEFARCSARSRAY